MRINFLFAVQFRPAFGVAVYMCIALLVCVCERETPIKLPEQNQLPKNLFQFHFRGNSHLALHLFINSARVLNVQYAKWNKIRFHFSVSQ